MNRTCTQLGYCKRAEIDPCVAECQFACLRDCHEQSKLDQFFTVISWLVIITTSVAMLGVVVVVIYGFGYDFLTRIG